MNNLLAQVSTLSISYQLGPRSRIKYMGKGYFMIGQ